LLEEVRKELVAGALYDVQKVLGERVPVLLQETWKTPIQDIINMFIYLSYKLTLFFNHERLKAHIDHLIFLPLVMLLIFFNS